MPAFPLGTSAAYLGGRADRLLAGAPQLRSKDADRAAILLSEDAQPARAVQAASDRSSRRLFERLLAQHAIRELTGRATFRLDGLQNGTPRQASVTLDTMDLAAQLRWRELMGRVEAVIFAAREPVSRDMLARVVGPHCNLDLIVDDIRAERRGRL